MMGRTSLIGMVLMVVATGCSGLRDTHERMHAVLWVQTAAEYRVFATTAYDRARSALEEALAHPTCSAMLEQAAGCESLPPAVILDLDETVLDNTPFEGALIEQRAVFSRAKWDEWVAEAQAPAVPGAVDFINFAEHKGVRVLFVTNRRASHESATRANLERLGIRLPVSPDTVLSEGEQPDWTSDKSSRRAFLAKQYRVLLLVGDDLGDFVSGARDAPERRSELAGRHTDHWGRSWFLIPNPIYGSWEEMLYAKGLSGQQVLDVKRSLAGSRVKPRP